MRVGLDGVRLGDRRCTESHDGIRVGLESSRRGTGRTGPVRYGEDFGARSDDMAPARRRGHMRQRLARRRATQVGHQARRRVLPGTPGSRGRFEDFTVKMTMSISIVNGCRLFSCSLPAQPVLDLFEP